MDPSFGLLRFKEFMNNNDELPTSVMEDLQKGMIKPRQELSDLDTEINELERRLTQLKARRGEVKKYLAQYDCLFSPIRRLPADILHHVFRYCLPSKRDPMMSAKEAPILLTRICRTWRQIAYSSPSIWAQLYITFSDEDSLRSDNDISYGLTRNYISETLRLRCTAVEEWLSRSGACPLSISLSYTSRIWVSNEDQSPGKSDYTLRLFRILTRFCIRWQRLELSIPIEVYRILEGMISTSQLSTLNTLRLCLYRQITATDQSVEESTGTLLQAPNLRSVSTTGASIPNQVTFFRNSKLLTSLYLNRTVSVSEAILILRSSPSMEYTRMILMSDFPNLPGANPDLFANYGRVSLPHLRGISIMDGIYSDPAGSRIYECIDAPQLEWLDYNKEPGYNDHEGDPICQTAITGLLHKSTKLRKLTLEASMLDAAQLRKILRSAPSIIHLVFGPEVRMDEKTLAPTPGIPISATGGQSWNLRDVFLQQHGEEDIGFDGSPLLPCLEILELSQGISLPLTDETLRDIILHRLDLYAVKEIALLKMVGVVFSRAMEIDISAELAAHSQNAAQVELALRYLDRPRPQTFHFIYSGYGINGFDRSWQFRDVEEEMLLVNGV